MKTRILSIDGGGIKGIIPGRILEYLENKVRENNKNYYISESFDLVAGTSTGGIIAIGLLCPAVDGTAKAMYSVTDLLKLYEDKGNEIFDTSVFQKIMNLDGIAHQKYKKDNMERLLKEYFGDIKLSELLKPCLISSYNIFDRKAVFFNKTDTETGGGFNDYYARDIARATSGAPTYFPPADIKTLEGTTYYPLVDGGVFANNPSLCALVEMNKLLSAQAKTNNKSYLLDLANISLLSIGTGVNIATKKSFTYDQTKDWGDLQWASPLIDIMMSASSETIDYQLQQLYSCTDNKENYIRIQPELKRAAPEMDDASSKNIQALLADVDEYITNNSDLLDKIADLLTVQSTVVS
ncbi:MAG TPA: patatin-like phospholipase family protein [Flavipsychrobacter sp.]|nr:patatin-like phospholipase family protein [Flavipsychrobacter sp.]